MYGQFSTFCMRKIFGERKKEKKKKRKEKKRKKKL